MASFASSATNGGARKHVWTNNQLSLKTMETQTTSTKKSTNERPKESTTLTTKGIPIKENHLKRGTFSNCIHKSFYLLNPFFWIKLLKI